MFFNKNNVNLDEQSVSQSQRDPNDDDILYQFDPQSNPSSSDQEMQGINQIFILLKRDFNPKFQPQSNRSLEQKHQEIVKNNKQFKQREIDFNKPKDAQKMEFYEPGYNYEDDEILPELKREDYVIKQIREEASIKEKPIQQKFMDQKIEKKIQENDEEDSMRQMPDNFDQKSSNRPDLLMVFAPIEDVKVKDEEVLILKKPQEVILHQKEELVCEQSDEDNNLKDIQILNAVQNSNPEGTPEGQNIEEQEGTNGTQKWPFPANLNISLFPSNLTIKKQFMVNPIPQGVTMSCSIKRAKAGLARLYPIYHLFTTQSNIFMLSAKKLAINSTSSYIITMDQDNYSTKNPLYLGKVNSNFMGTEFHLYDNGVNPKKTKNTMSIRNQVGVVYYESNIMQNKGPRRMKILIPKVSRETNLPKVFMPLSSNEGIQWDHANGKNEFIDVFINKSPKWNSLINAYVLNFYGRVDKPSVKNFQLIQPDVKNLLYFQFGRINDLEFNLDFKWPFSPLQAMQICASSFDFKFACE